MIRSDRKQYLKLEVHGSELSVALPADSAEEMGIRAVLTPDGAREIFDVLLEESEPEDTVWSRRIKNNTTRLRSGDVRTIAGLIRDLTRRNTEKRLSFGEMNLLREATGPFVAELSIVLAVPEAEIEAMIEAAVLEDVKPTIAQDLATAV